MIDGNALYCSQPYLFLLRLLVYVHFALIIDSARLHHGIANDYTQRTLVQNDIGTGEAET